MNADFAPDFATDGKLIRLFQRHFPDPVTAVLRLDNYLSSFALSFHLRAQLREMCFPAQPALPDGVPSLIYYFLPNSGWGSDQPRPANPLDANFVRATDGIGLNLGCPVRLLRALDVLARLPLADQSEIRDSLKNPKQHFAAIEELLWLMGWKSPECQTRGGTLPRASGNVDWHLQSCGYPLYLEAKFRPSDWPRLSDFGTFEPISGSFLGKAAHKFPHIRVGTSLHLVGVTTYENLTQHVFEQIAEELVLNPQIDAVIFRSLAQTTHVISLHVGMRDALLPLLSRPASQDYPTNYFVLTHIQQRNERVIERAKIKNQISCKSGSTATCWGIAAQTDIPIIFPEDAYRINIVSRAADGEPQFDVVPKHIAQADVAA